jgi:uncharacterized protein YdeI (YjbR/CyaY-like superfamily)
MGALQPADILACADAAEWDAWLADHHADSSGIWLLIARKGAALASVSTGEALDVALCYGWIDSQRRGHDESFYLQRYSPRRPRSPWSMLNVKRVEALIEAGRMRPRGLGEVAAAQADGRWAAAYQPQRNVEVPPDLAAALERDPRAAAAFGRLDKTRQYSVILPVLKATTPVMRSARVQKAIQSLAASG